MSQTVTEADAEIEVLEVLMKHARALSHTRNPQRRIVASKWELQFEGLLEQEKQHKATLQGQEEVRA